MADPTLRPNNVAVLVRLMANDTDLAAPNPVTDAIPVEIDSLTRNSPWTTEQSNEATGTYVGGAPLVVGQPATVGFRSRLKGAGAGVAYTALVKPPLHAAIQACGWRGQFRAAIASALVSAGTSGTATLANTFPATNRALNGVPLQITAGVGVGGRPLVIDYDATRLALLSDNFDPPLDATTSIGMPAHWSYAGTSPVDAAARAVDHPMVIVYIYRDGVLWKYTHCRGLLTADGATAKPGYGAFTFSGIFAGREDAAVPATLVVANHLAPTLVQGSARLPAVLLNRRPIAISTWSLDAGTQTTSPADPNTTYGFGAGEISERIPLLKLDPLATQVATRDVITDIGVGSTYQAVLRHGSQAGNSWSLTLPRVQPVAEEDGTRDKLLSEQLQLQALSAGRDAVGRDSDRILAFW
jgi:hypothetical protein